MVRAICRRLRTSERLSRFVEGLTRHHLVLGFLVHERPLDRRAVYRYLTRTYPVEVEVTLLSCADRLATRGKNADRAIDAHLELAQELMPAALEWRRNGPPSCRCAATSWPRGSGSSRGPSWAACWPSCERPPTRARSASRDDAIEIARRLRQQSRLR